MELRISRERRSPGEGNGRPIAETVTDRDLDAMEVESIVQQGGIYE